MDGGTMEVFIGIFPKYVIVCCGKVSFNETIDSRPKKCRRFKLDGRTDGLLHFTLFFFFPFSAAAAARTSSHEEDKKKKWGKDRPFCGDEKRETNETLFNRIIIIIITEPRTSDATEERTMMAV